MLKAFCLMVLSGSLLLPLSVSAGSVGKVKIFDNEKMTVIVKEPGCDVRVDENGIHVWPKGAQMYPDHDGTVSVYDDIEELNRGNTIVVHKKRQE